MKIDGHTHACGSCLTEESIQNYMKVHNLDKVLLCGGEPGSKKDYNYPMISNWFHGERVAYFFNQIISKVTKKRHLSEYLDQQNKAVYKIAKKMPDKVKNVYWINPQEYDCMEKMVEFHENYGFDMLKLHQCWTPFEIDSQMCDEIFTWAGKNNCAVFIHLLSKKQVEKFAIAANLHPNTSFIVAHMIGVNYLKEKLEHKNVYFDLSAPQMYSKQIMKCAIENFGVNRILYGSDTPYGIDNLNRIEERLDELYISQEDKENIFGENIERLLP